MADYIKGINPTIIKWARERSGYTLEDVAKSFKKDVTTISNWELGTQAPTYVQLDWLTSTNVLSPYSSSRNRPKNPILWNSLHCDTLN